jgi:hypothetical protein
MSEYGQDYCSNVAEAWYSQSEEVVVVVMLVVVEG